MLKLKISKEPYWISPGYGVKLKVRPCTSAVFYEAKAYMNSRLAKLAEEYKADGGSAEDLENPVKREALADRFLLTGLGIAGIMEWQGVEDADDGQPAPLTEEKIEELFSAFWVIAENFRNEYCGLRELMEAEKNVSAPAPGGTSAAGGATAEDARI